MDMVNNGRAETQTAQDGLVRSLLADASLRAKSLIVTVYGDAIAPHGGTVWLGSLIRLVAPFGLSERLVRTAVLRLSRDDWLASEQIGRRSYYSLTDSGRRRIEDAYRRVFAFGHAPWTGEWTLVLTGLGDNSTEARTRVQRELTWQGFGVMAPGVLASPSADRDALRHLLQDLGLVDRTVVMRATAEALSGAASHVELLRNCWDLDKVADGYRAFLDRFRPVWRALEAADRLDPEACFLIRTLLIHDYRRVLLRDPQLPEELLPVDWAGAAARALCRNLYRRILHPAERHLMTTLETAEGPLPEAAPYFYARFGGLPRDEAGLREVG